jgi:hypothetical protein
LPGINFFVFLGLNGYLFGRTYFEVVALRRLDRGTARAVRRHFAGRVFIGGLVITGLFAAARQPDRSGDRDRVHGACFPEPAAAGPAGGSVLIRRNAVYVAAI